MECVCGTSRSQDEDAASSSGTTPRKRRRVFAAIAPERKRRRARMIAAVEEDSMRHATLIASLLLAANSWAGLPDNGLPDNGLPDNGLPDNGLPDNGLPDNGNSPDALINSPLFFDAATHAYWVGNPFTGDTINAGMNPLRIALTDPFSALVMAYQWQLCHPTGDDATVVDSRGATHTFHGRVGLCVLANGHGWHKDQP